MILKKLRIFTLLTAFSTALILCGQEQLQAHRTGALKSMCKSKNFEKALLKPEHLRLVPKYKDSYWRDSIPMEMRNNFIKQAEYFLGNKWQGVDAMLFMQFKKDGNRTNYEKFFNEKRKRLGSLVIGEILEGEGRFMPDIINGLQSLCEETWWGIPAHYPQELPIPEIQTLALFSAETGNLAAWTLYMLGDAIKGYSPLLYQQVQDNIKHRINDEGLRGGQWWRKGTSNWNPWICSNWLACELMAETDAKKRIKGISAIAESLDGFIDNYPDDGGCDEGAQYWDRAAGSLMDCLVLLDAASNGYIQLANDEKVRAICDFLAKMNIGNGFQVNFADASPFLSVRPEWFTGAQLLGNEELMSMISQVAIDRNYFTKPSPIFRADNVAHLGRELMVLANLSRLKNKSGAVKLHYDTYLPDLQIVSARSQKDSTEGLYFAAKGGHNAEAHNHNDVGSFIVYVDGMPLFIDPGNATYTGKSFTNERYTLWNTQSGYHNLPQINGIDQHQGKQYKARNINAEISDDRAIFTLDIADAYPAEAHVSKWVRTIDLERGEKLTITEKYQLSENAGDTQIVLMSQAKPQVTRGKIIYQIGNKKWELCYDPNELDASFKSIDVSDDQLVKDHWGDRLYRLLLRVKKPALEAEITYVVKPFEP